MRGTATIAALTSLLLLASSTSRGQAPTKLEFEAVSVKPHAGPVTVTGLSMSGTRVEETAVSLMDLVADAFNVRLDQISNAPDWGKEGKGGALYDIEAKASGGEPAREQLRQMLQSLLADRFKLVIRRENVETPVYALVFAKTGAKLGPSDDRVGIRGWPTDTGKHMEGTVNMDFLARQLSGASGRPVMDRTGLAGNFKIRLDWTPDNFTPPDATASLSIFTAVQDQLGLKLEPTKAPVERLIIEHAEKPDTD